MSSTNRGRKGGGDAEFYPTPAWATTSIVRRLPELPRGHWLEAGAGDGAIIRAVNQLRSDVLWTAVELRLECRDDLVTAGADEVHIATFQEWARARIEAHRQRSGPRPFQVAAFNPPFSQALAFVLLCLELADWVLCLQRLPWLGDDRERHAHFSRNMPDTFNVGRIDFDGRGGDSVPYAWFAWGPEQRGRSVGHYELLPLTPPAEKRGPRRLPPPRQVELF
jgi:hypothetical protein